MGWELEALGGETMTSTLASSTHGCSPGLEPVLAFLLPQAGMGASRVNRLLPPKAPPESSK